MIKVDNSYMFRKILLGLLPACVFWYNYSLMTTGQYSGVAFLILWGLCIWNVIDSKDSNFVIERHLRLTEVAFFLLPLSSIVFTFVIGAQTVGMTGDEFEQAGAAIGTAIGGTFIILFNLLIGSVLGLIMHIFAGKYDKKVKNETLSVGGKHGILLTTAVLYIIAIVLGTTAAGNAIIEEEQKTNEIKQNLQVPGETLNQESNQENNDVEVTLIDKGFQEGDIYSGSFMDQVTIDLKFKNKTDNKVIGVKGELVFYDVFSDEVKRINISYDEPIEPNNSNTWKGAVEHNEFISSDVKFKDLSIDTLKYHWELEKIVYSD